MGADKYSLVPRPSIIANVVEGLVKLLHRMMSGGHWKAWLIVLCISSTAVYRKCHASQHPPDVILRRSLAMIEGRPGNKAR